MNDEEHWVHLADFGAAYEAEYAAGLLKDADIPALIRGPETGIFGPGFAGATTHGVTLFVPGSELERARQILEDDKLVE
jgi:hypothetical protein